MIVWSYGGGVQSAAIAVLIASGRLPRPDLAVIADTGREAETTWSYMRDVVLPHVAPTVIEIASHELATVDLYSANGTLLIPAYTDQSGAVGQLPGYCSVEWKRRVVRRWLRAKGVAKCSLWLGISVDEVGRAKPADVEWLTHEYPLLDLHIRRRECLELVRDAGLPPAPKSSCFMCPYRGDKEWSALTDGDFAKAQAFENEIRAKDPNVYLRRDLRPVSSLLHAPPADDLPLFGEVKHCDSGFCWT